MNLTAVIDQLTEIHRKHGDIPVQVIGAQDNGGDMVQHHTVGMKAVTRIEIADKPNWTGAGRRAETVRIL